MTGSGPRASAGPPAGRTSAGAVRTPNTDAAKIAAAEGLTTSMYNEKAPNDGHRRNLLSTAFHHVGIDVVPGQLRQGVADPGLQQLTAVPYRRAIPTAPAGPGNRTGRRGSPVSRPGRCPGRSLPGSEVHPDRPDVGQRAAVAGDAGRQVGGEGGRGGSCGTQAKLAWHQCSWDRCCTAMARGAGVRAGTQVVRSRLALAGDVDSGGEVGAEPAAVGGVDPQAGRRRWRSRSAG